MPKVTSALGCWATTSKAVVTGGLKIGDRFDDMIGGDDGADGVLIVLVQDGGA